MSKPDEMPWLQITVHVCVDYYTKKLQVPLSGIAVGKVKEGQWGIWYEDDDKTEIAFIKRHGEGHTLCRAIPEPEARALLAERKALRELCEMAKDLLEERRWSEGDVYEYAATLWRKRFEGGGE